jgi:4'-phosphopantetheinyl transferase
MEKIFLIEGLTTFTSSDYHRVIASVPSQKQESIGRMKQHTRRVESAAGYALLRYILVREYGLKRTTRLTFMSTGQYGKPRFVAPHLPAFNISHTTDKVVVVVDALPLGVDIERIQADTFGVAHMFHAKEQAYLRQTQHGRDAMFTSMWCLKEAYSKHQGSGITEAILRQNTFRPCTHYIYESKKLSLLSYDDHIIAVCGSHFYGENAIEVVDRAAL